MPPSMSRPVLQALPRGALSRILPRSPSISASHSRTSCDRLIHTSDQRPSPPIQAQASQYTISKGQRKYEASRPPPNELPPLSVLPLSSILRSLMTTTVSSSPVLLGPSMSIMTVLANSTSPLLNPDKNLLLRFFLKKTFYAQFCAGENPQEVRRTIDNLKNIGFSGVILGYAREVVMKDEEKNNLSIACKDKSRQAQTMSEIQAWADGTLQTVRLASPGDFVALKFTGAGLQALHYLAEQLPPSPALADAIDRICQLAVGRGVRLLFDAEQQAVQAGIDDWTMTYMRKYNAPNSAIVYGTYQGYLKATPAILSRHLQMARDGGFALGVKLVRGAYLGSDPRHLIHNTKEDTDAAYDGIAEALLRREWQAPLNVATSDKQFPVVNLVVASHNAESVQKAEALLSMDVTKTTDVAFGQLQGMADEISCKLVLDAKKAQAADVVNGRSAHAVRPYKYLVWGSTGECMKYLLRRAHENRDAVQRTKSSRDAMWQELVRRTKAAMSRTA